MALITFHTRRYGVLAMTRSDCNTMMRKAWEEVGNYWHTHYREKHFTNAGATEYKYQPRSGERGRGPRLPGFFKKTYTGSKLKYKGHTRPLDFSGLSRARARMRIVTATSHGVRISIDAPALNFQGKNKKGAPSPTKPSQDMTAISSPELTHLERLMQQYIERRLVSRDYSKSTTIS